MVRRRRQNMSLKEKKSRGWITPGCLSAYKKNAILIAWILNKFVVGG